jgi:hypothetical protein
MNSNLMNKNLTAIRTAELWITLLKRQNEGRTDFEVVVTDDAVDISVEGWRWGIHKEKARYVSARRLRGWRTQRRIFHKLNNRIIHLCLSVNARLLEVPEPGHQFNLENSSNRNGAAR